MQGHTNTAGAVSGRAIRDAVKARTQSVGAYTQLDGAQRQEAVREAHSRECGAASVQCCWRAWGGACGVDDEMKDFL